MSTKIYDETGSRKNIGGVQRLVFFNNGYGASIIEGFGSYGLELAVLKGNKEDWSITYDTEITADVIGHNSADDINDLLLQISKLEE